MKHKAEPVYRKGIWVGKSSWSDNHICLTRSGAVEARSIRRLPEQFDGYMLINAKGVPWQYSVQGILMKLKSARKRPAIAEGEVHGDEQVLEEEAKQAGTAVAIGLYTPGGFVGGESSAAITTAAPSTPMLGASMQSTPAVEARQGSKTPALPKQAVTDPSITVPERTDEADEAGRSRKAESAEELRGNESPKKARLQEASSASGLKRDILPLSPVEIAAEQEQNSPKRLRVVDEEFPTGDNKVAEGVLQSMLNDDSDEEVVEEGGKPPDISEEELRVLDGKAIMEEEDRLLKMEVLEKIPDDADEDPESYNITTKMVVTWKNRKEKGGWFRRARLVARQFKWSVFTDDSFAPTSASVIVRLLLQFLVMAGDLAAYVMDIKDAFLMIKQPDDEKATVTTPNGKYKLLRNLPGQRNAAAQWFGGFCAVAKEYGMEMDAMQPTLMRKKGPQEKGKRLLLTIHVDDLLMIGDEPEVEKFIEFMTKDKGWKAEVQGPMYRGKFKYLKRNIEWTDDGVTIRADAAHIEELARFAGVEHKKPRATPTDSKSTKISKDDEPMPSSEVTKYRSCIGKLLYIGPDRPDVQFVSQGLASFIQVPTRKAWQYLKHVSSYLLGTKNEGILLQVGARGKSVLNTDDDGNFEIENGEKSLIEVICDADYAGDQVTRKSVSGVQFFLNGNMMESYVRSQRAIALSSGESKYICMVGGASESMFLQHCWEFIAGEKADVVVRSDSSAARSLATRIGIGRSRRIAAGMLWLQQKWPTKT